MAGRPRLLKFPSATQRRPGRLADFSHTFPSTNWTCSHIFAFIDHGAILSLFCIFFDLTFPFSCLFFFLWHICLFFLSFIFLCFLLLLLHLYLPILGFLLLYHLLFLLSFLYCHHLLLVSFCSFPPPSPPAFPSSFLFCFLCCFIFNIGIYGITQVRERNRETVTDWTVHVYVFFFFFCVPIYLGGSPFLVRFLHIYIYIYMWPFLIQP